MVAKSASAANSSKVAEGWRFDHSVGEAADTFLTLDMYYCTIQIQRQIIDHHEMFILFATT
jgi:hypothetical protein